MENKKLHYWNRSGKVITEEVDQETAAKLLNWEIVRTPLGVSVKNPEKEDSMGIPCSMLLNEKGKTAREFVQNELAQMPSALLFDSVELILDFYLLPDMNMKDLVICHGHELEPVEEDRVMDTVFSWPGVQAHVTQSSERAQYELHLEAKSIPDVLAAVRLVKVQLTESCRKMQLRPFFVPKMDRLPGNNLLIVFKGIGKDTDAWRAAMAGIMDHAKALTLLFCNQVNSYKRNTPQFLPDKWRVPCYLRVTEQEDRNAIARLDVKQKTFTFYFADCHCNYPLAIAALLWMLRDGYQVHGDEEDLDELVKAVSVSEEKMPNSLNVACRFWKENPEAEKLLGAELAETLYKDAQLEWKTYCDIAHPWELMRGLDYEG